MPGSAAALEPWPHGASAQQDQHEHCGTALPALPLVWRCNQSAAPPAAAVPPALCPQANGRTVRSLAYVLSMYPNVKMYFVAPDEAS